MKINKGDIKSYGETEIEREREREREKMVFKSLQRINICK